MKYVEPERNHDQNNNTGDHRVIWLYHWFIKHNNMRLLSSVAWTNKKIWECCFNRVIQGFQQILFEDLRFLPCSYYPDNQIQIKRLCSERGHEITHHMSLFHSSWLKGMLTSPDQILISPSLRPELCVPGTASDETSLSHQLTLNTLNNDDPLQPGTDHLHHHRLLSLLLQVRGDQLESDDAANKWLHQMLAWQPRNTTQGWTSCHTRVQGKNLKKYLL